MGLFGKAAKTKTEVKPSKDVEAILKKVVNLTQDEGDKEFIKQQAAQLTKQDHEAIQKLADSTSIKQAANTLSDRLNVGMQQQTAANAGLSKELTQPTTLKGILADKQTLMQGANQRALAQGTRLNPALQGSAAARKANKLYGNAARANNTLQQGQVATRLAAGNQLSNQANRIQALNAMNNVAGSNVGMGLTGAGLNQQATANQLQAGNILQGVQQAQNNVDWSNANRQSLSGWEALNDKLNTLNTVSGLAGYTSTGTSSAPSKGQQLLGAGIQGLGIAGNLGAFNSASPFAGLNQSQTNQAYNSALNLGGVDTPMNYASNMQNVRNAASNMGGGSGFMNTNLGQGLQSGYNTIRGLF